MPTWNVVHNAKIRLRIYCQRRDQISLNVLHYNTNVSAGLSQDALAIMTSIASTLKPLYADVMGANATFVGGSIQDVTIPLATSQVYVRDAAAGTGTGDDVAGQVSALISWKTAYAGRKRRGRTYIGFVSEGLEGSGGKPDVGLLADLATLAAALKTLTITNGGDTTILDLNIRHKDRTVVDDKVTDYNVRTFFATQRSRGDFGKQNQLPQELS